MMRIRNEERWLQRSLERTWQVCQRVVIFDDHSSDRSLGESLKAIGNAKGIFNPITRHTVYTSDDGERELHWLTSPFQPVVDEVRDKNYLWDYVCRTIQFRHVLCLDGDEMLSRKALRNFPSAIDALVNGGASVIVMPFVYVWDSEALRRVDGVYRDIRHARLFTTDRAPDRQSARFVSSGHAGFHCGSIPAQLNVNHRDVHGMDIVHFGYVDKEIRERKLTFYQALDPNNEGEGYYMHIIGEPNHLAPGPLQLVPWSDV